MNLGLFFEKFIGTGIYKTALEGLKNTLIIAICGLIIGIIIGSLVATVKVAGKRNKVAKAFSYVGEIYTGLFRGTPIVVQLMISHYVIFRAITIPTPWEAVLVFGLNSGAYVAEIMRGGIESVDIGQLEAGRSLGLSYPTTMVRVVIPQAFKNVVPTLGNELIMLVKDTSVASYCATLALPEAFDKVYVLTYDIITSYIILALIYLVIVILLTVLIKFIEKRLRKSERR